MRQIFVFLYRGLGSDQALSEVMQGLATKVDKHVEMSVK